jgi:hypothetical protein
MTALDELEIVWVPAEALSAFGVFAVGWWATNYDGGTRFGPYETLDECALAVLAAGYSVPNDQRPD